MPLLTELALPQEKLQIPQPCRFLFTLAKNGHGPAFGSLSRRENADTFSCVRMRSSPGNSSPFMLPEEPFSHY